MGISVKVAELETQLAGAQGLRQKIQTQAGGGMARRAVHPQPRAQEPRVGDQRAGQPHNPVEPEARPANDHIVPAALLRRRCQGI